MNMTAAVNVPAPVGIKPSTANPTAMSGPPTSATVRTPTLSQTVPMNGEMAAATSAPGPIAAATPARDQCVLEMISGRNTPNV